MDEYGPDLIRKFLQSLDVGLDTNSQELQETPARVWQAWRFFTSGYGQDPAEVLKTFDEGYDELIFQSALPFYSMCAHHMIPFHGLAHIAYLPNGKIVGLSKLARLLEMFARRLTIQERIGVQVADALMRCLDARGAAVVLQCRHMCYCEDTEVLTMNGFKPFSSLDQTERVAQYDIDSGIISYTKPRSYIVDRYYGKMHYWKTKSIDLLITPEHRMVCQTDWKFRHGHSFEFIKAKNVNGYLMYLPAAGTYLGVGKKQIEIGDIEFTEDQFCGFMGIYLSDGSFSYDNNLVIITKTEANVKDYSGVREFLYSLPLEWRERRQVKGGSVTGFVCKSSVLTQYVSRFGKSFDKYIPHEVQHASLEGRLNFLRLYLMGDGYYDPISCQMGGSSRSKRLAEGLQQLFIGLGYGAKMTAPIYGGVPQYTVRARIMKEKAKSYNSVKDEQRIADDYDGMIYCVNVPKGALVIRRQGSAAISGNCMEARGVQKTGTVTMTSAMRGKFMEQPALREEFMLLVSSAMQGIKTL